VLKVCFGDLKMLCKQSTGLNLWCYIFWIVLQIDKNLCRGFRKLLLAHKKFCDNTSMRSLHCVSSIWNFFFLRQLYGSMSKLSNQSRDPGTHTNNVTYLEWLSLSNMYVLCHWDRFNTYVSHLRIYCKLLPLWLRRKEWEDKGSTILQVL